MDGTGSQDTNETIVEDLERDSKLKRCHIRPVVLPRDGDELRGRFFEGSGISDPEGPRITVTCEDEDSGCGVSGRQKLNIPADEIDDYIAVLEGLKSAMSTEGENK